MQTVGFQKIDFSVFSAFGAENTKIGFITRIVYFQVLEAQNLIYDRYYAKHHIKYQNCVSRDGGGEKPWLGGKGNEKFWDSGIVVSKSAMRSPW